MRIFRLGSITLVVILLLWPIFRKGLHNWLHSSNYGRKTIVLPDGNKIYIVRELWGHREQLYITQDSDGCKPANAMTDYLLPVDAWSTLLYRTNPVGWTIYSDIAPREIQIPTREWTHSKPTVVVARNPGVEDLYKNHEHYGISVMDVPLNEVCLVNLFREKNSLR
jgi:hypothetical protein